VTDSLEIVTLNSRFSTAMSSIIELPSDCDNDRLPKMARLAPKSAILPFPVVGHCHNRPGAVSLSLPWSNTRFSVGILYLSVVVPQI